MTRLCLLSVLSLLTCKTGWSADSTLEATVKRLLDPQASFTGFDVHQLRWSGDAVAVAALRILDPESTPTEQQVSTLLWMIKDAFYDLDLISDSVNRNPAVSLFVLKHVAARQYSSKLKTQIARTTEFLVGVRRNALRLENHH